MRDQQRRSEREESLEEHSSEIKEDIRKMLAQTHHAKGEGVRQKDSAVPVEAPEIVRLMKQLALQYDEIEGYLKCVADRTEEMKTETFPIDLISSLVQSTVISPSLVKIMSDLSEENRELRKCAEDAKMAAEKSKAHLQSLSSTGQTKKLELKYLEQTVADAAKELKAARDDAVQQRKRIIELEAALEAQKKIGKELLREKVQAQKGSSVHEEEKQLLKRLIDEKDEIIEQLRQKYERLEYELQTSQRDRSCLKIQYERMSKRAALKEKALSLCNAEMERLIAQLDRLTRMDTQKKEKLEHLKIIRKRLEHENQDLMTLRAQARPKSTHRHRGRQPPTIEPLSEEESSHSLAEPDFPSRASSFSYPLDEAVGPVSASTSASESDLSESANQTTTSFKEMQKKSEEIARKFTELETLLQEIKRGNENDLDTVEDKISKSTQPRP